jgi:hypothetical protein
MMRAGRYKFLVEGTEKKSHAKSRRVQRKIPLFLLKKESHTKVDESLFRWRTERRTVFLWKP